MMEGLARVSDEVAANVARECARRDLEERRRDE